MTPLEKAIQIVGNGSKLARILNVGPMAVTQWRRRGVPPERCLAIEQAVNGQVTARDLRPDIFGTQPEPQKKAA